MNASADGSTEIRVAALYHFARLAEPEDLKSSLDVFCRSRAIKGTLLLAKEGINGTVAGTEQAITELVRMLKAVPEFEGIDIKYSVAPAMPFHRMKVRVKREIVTMGVDGIDPARDAGTYVEPEEWNALIADPDTVVIDTRNDYEVALGSFQGAIDPGTSSFSEFPGWVRDNLDLLKGRKLAMFCTGGIRCEKATAYLRLLGIDEVYHLRGGILRYLEHTDPDESLWNGECFVFDERVSLVHGLEEGDALLCRACRRPLTVEDRKSLHYVDGVSCRYCYEERTDADRARYAERVRQIELAGQVNKVPHIRRK